MSSWLHESNRLRQPHEYTNYWKWKEAASETARVLGIPEDATKTHLLAEMKELTLHLNEERAALKKSRTNLDLKDKEINRLNNDLAKQQMLVETEKGRRAYQELNIKDLTTLLLRRGDHDAKCNWIRMLAVGRVQDTEDEQCDCGWSTIKEVVKATKGQIGGRPDWKEFVE
jgi:hypothetical protein